MSYSLDKPLGMMGQQLVLRMANYESPIVTRMRELDEEMKARMEKYKCTLAAVTSIKTLLTPVDEEQGNSECNGKEKISGIESDTVNYLQDNHGLNTVSQSPDKVSEILPWNSPVGAVEEVPEIVVSGDLRKVTYRGKSCDYYKTLGLDYLKYLIDNPRKMISCFELETAVKKIDPQCKEDQLYQDHNVNIVDQENSEHVDQMIDSKAIEGYKKRLTELDSERKHAEQIGDHESILRIEKETDDIETKFKPFLNRHGKIRKVAINKERTRQRVCVAIRRSIKKIEKDSPDLAKYLKASAPLGSTIVYNSAYYNNKQN